MLNLLTFVGILSVLIIAHEFGHFIVAKRSGVKVERFSIGFGPALFRRKGKETEFLLCLLPLGGYVKLAGDSRAEFNGGVNEFLSKPAKIKIAIVLAGPLFNYLFAFFLFWGIAMLGMTQAQIDPVVGMVEVSSPAQKCNIQKGDKIIEANRKKISDWEEVQEEISQSQGRVELKLKRADSIEVVNVPTVTKEFFDEFGGKRKVYDIGIYPYIPAVIGKAMKGHPAQKAGIRERDRVLAVNNKPVELWKEMTDIIYASKGIVSMRIERNGREVIFNIVPEQKEIIDESGKRKDVSFVGIAPFTKTKVIKYNFFESINKGLKELFNATFITIKGFTAMILGILPLRAAITGPLGIYYITGEAVKVGINAILHLMAVLNVSLAIINLMPLPLFDGGHILVFLIERIRKRQFSEVMEQLFTRVGFVIIAVIVLFVFYNDIVRFGSKIWGK
jgi:regulator of sigma E protease